MTCYEKSLQDVTKAGINVKENIPFESHSDGLIKGNKIGLSKNLKTSIEKHCVLAEESAHYQISSTDIIDLRNANNRKEKKGSSNVVYFEPTLGVLERKQ